MRFTTLFPTFFSACLLLTLCPGVPGYGQDPYDLSDISTSHRLDKHLEVFIDSSGRLPFEKILTTQFQRRFKDNHENLTFGYLKAPLWLKIKTRRPSPGTQWVLEIPAPFLEYVDFYQLEKGDRWHHSMSGYFRTQSQREHQHTGHLLPLKFGADSVSIVYVRIGGVSPKTFPVYAIEENRLAEKNRYEDLAYGIFFGILVVMFFYNLFLYITLRQKNYLYYFCTIICTFLIFAAISGYGGRFLWPEFPLLNYFAGKLTLELLIIFLSVFTIRFLEVKRYSLGMYYVLVSLIPLAVLAFILVTTNTFAFAGNTLVSLSTIVFMAAGIVVKIKGNKTANYFIAAWTLYFTGGLLITLRNSGVFDFGFWTTHFVEIGAVLETAIIGFALGEKYRTYKREKEEAQRYALEIQEEAMTWLESKVKERTDELSKAHDHLQRTLETNRQQTLIIKNKNSELDSFFQRISHDLKGPISSILGLTMLAKVEVRDKHALDFFQRQQIQIERISNIVNGLVRLTRLNDAALRTEMIDFNKMINDCIASFHSLPNFSKILFKKQVEPDIEFYSEWTLLNGIVQNLIENSIKYARDEDAYVSVTVRAESEWIVLQVEDNGQGIPAEAQPSIFEMFYRATRDKTGSGLGLYILKRSVDRLKGTVEIKSDVGTGTTFTVRLPSMEETAERVNEVLKT